MSLDQRLERARDDYRALAVPEGRAGEARHPRARRSQAWLVAAAVLAVAGIVGVAVVSARDDDGRVEVAGPAGTATTSSTSAPAPAGEPGLTVEPTGEPGTFTLRPTGLAPDPSWLDLRAEHPERVEGPEAFPAFWVNLCADGASFEAAAGPFGEDLWDQHLDPDGSTCSTFLTGITIDPDDPNRALTVTLSPLGYGYGGWFDCREDQCSLDVRRSIVHSVDPGGALSGEDVSVATAFLPQDAPWPDTDRPTLTIDTPGPHATGQVVDVTIAGLPAGVDTTIGVCDVHNPWGCAYDLTERGNGQHQVTLHQWPLEGCGPESCYLELDAQGQGLAPLATAPLDTPG